MAALRPRQGGGRSIRPSRAVVALIAVAVGTFGVSARSAVLRRAWEPGRFARTVVFFRGSPWKLLLPRFLQGKDPQASRTGSAPSTIMGDTMVIDWGLTDGLPVAQSWGPLDDVVMGGVSSSRIAVEGEGERRRLVFLGRTSRENNGGFCSFRSRLFSPPFNLSGYDGLAFTARCMDGLRYKVQLRDNAGWDSVGWAASFDTGASGEEVEVRVPFSALQPNFRSQVVPNSPPFRSDAIASVQFVLSAFEFNKAMNPRFKEGKFRLELGPIRAYRAADG